MEDRHIISEKATLFEALGQLNSLSGEIMTLMVVDDDCRMVGTLTDGDVRRSLLSGTSLDCSVTEAMHVDFKSLRTDNIDLHAIKNYRNRGIKMLPILTADGKIDRLLDLDHRHTLLPVSAVLMAGGRGERLRPLTDKIPKPLLPVAGKAIIDYNIEALAAAGISDITVTTRYLADEIARHFSRPVAGVNVKCVREDMPLGTIGALSLIKDRDSMSTTLVMNSDLLTTISFEEMYLTHVEQKADITVAVIPYTVSVPYAILATANNCVTGIEEKPTYSYYANAGIYLIANRLLDELTLGQRVDATDLIQSAIERGLKVTCYPINGTWIDVGTPADFKHAEELMKHLGNFSRV